MDTEPVPAGTLILELVLLVILIGINGFFVAVEFSVVASRRSRIEQLGKDGSRAAAIVHKWVGDNQSKDRLIAASQLGITVASLALGMVGENAFESILSTWFSGFEGLSPVMENVVRALPVTLSLIIVSGLHVIFGEQVPKVASLRAPERLALIIALPMEWFRRITSPFNMLLDAMANAVLRMFGMEHSGGHSMLYSVEELKQIVTESEQGGVIGGEERDILHAVFDLRDMLTRQVMVPRTEVTMLEADALISDLINLADRLPYSKFPVYERDSDHILGIVYVKDLIHVLASHQENTPLRGLVRNVLYVPETLPVDDLLTRFRAQRQHMAVVLDEYGGTAGIVTLEDILEELVGEVQGEFEKGEAPEIQRLPDGSGLVSGLVLISEFNDIFSLNITDENYDTIGGFVMGQLERIPRVGDAVAVDGVNIRVENMDGLRIDRLSILPENPGS
jgi:CBS domain containing-hemolysin-like protein